jgi:hypothetical protein
MTSSTTPAATPRTTTEHAEPGHAHASTVHGAALSAGHALAMAREDIHHAISAADTHHCLRYAESAPTNAGHVLTDPRSAASERQYAGYYFADAEAIIAQHSADPDAVGC